LNVAIAFPLELHFAKLTGSLNFDQRCRTIPPERACGTEG
jgi:hypothetical protein